MEQEEGGIKSESESSSTGSESVEEPDENAGGSMRSPWCENVAGGTGCIPMELNVGEFVDLRLGKLLLEAQIEGCRYSCSREDYLLKSSFEGQVHSGL